MAALEIKITDMAGAYAEHSMVISNFLINVGSQLQGSLCKIFGDNVQYKWIMDGVEKTVIPDASINCRFRQRRGNSFFNNPRFVMEVLSPSTEQYDRGGKMDLYCQQEIDECWIVDWRKRQIEIYVLDYEENVPKYYIGIRLRAKIKMNLKSYISKMLSLHLMTFLMELMMKVDRATFFRKSLQSF